jgi:ABC-type lipoprotein export system ATPase subunit
MVTHDSATARCADRIITMKDGLLQTRVAGEERGTPYVLADAG